jgi:hypothetical protein
VAVISKIKDACLLIGENRRISLPPIVVRCLLQRVFFCTNLELVVPPSFSAPSGFAPSVISMISYDVGKSRGGERWGKDPAIWGVCLTLQYSCSDNTRMIKGENHWKRIRKSIGARFGASCFAKAVVVSKPDFV